MPLLWALVRVERAEQLDVLAGDQVRLDDRLARLVERDDEPAQRQRRRQARGPRRRSPFDQRRPRPPAATNSTKIADHRAQVEREAAAPDRRQEAAEEVQVGVGRLGDEVEHRAQRAAVGDPRQERDQDPGEDQDDVDDEQRADVVGDVAAGDRVAAAQASPRILASEAATAAANASRDSLAVKRLEPRLGAAAGRGDGCRSAPRASRVRSSSAVPAAVSTTSERASSGSRPSAAVAVGDRLDDQRQVGGRAAHHRGGERRSARRRSPRPGPATPSRSTTRRPSASSTPLGRRRSRSPPCRTSTPRLGITRIAADSGKAAATRVDRGRAEHREDRRRRPAPPAATASSVLRLHRRARAGRARSASSAFEPTASPPTSVGERAGPAGAGVGEQHPLGPALAGGPAARPSRRPCFPQPAKPTIIAAAAA